MNKIIALFLISTLIYSNNSTNTSKDYSLFDFGSNKTPLGIYYSLIDSTNSYNKDLGYGLINVNAKSYYEKGLELITNKTICDGIIAEDSIEFRVDLEPGNYIVEILMDGGELTFWKGSITINETEIADSLLCYSANYEGESPPPYWGLLKEIINNQSYLIIKIKAFNQPTKIAGISIYSADFGPIRNIEGNAVAKRNLEAPNATLCLDLINEAKILEAKRIIDAIPIEFRFEKALLLFALASRIEVQNPRDYIETAYYYLKDEAEVNQNSAVLLNMRLAELILNGNQFYNIAGWLWNHKIFPESGFFNYINIAGDSYEEVSAIPEHPLFLAATWLKAKTAYWIWVEQHEQQLIELADKYFGILKKYFPHNDLLNEYMGERNYDIYDELKPVNVPEWAFLQNKVSQTILNIIHYWVNNRQANNGEFGGKYDDDCEMLRWWPISRIVFNDSTALKGMKKLVDGIWNSDWIEKGFSKKVRDVEHSSEPVADTQPMMIGFDYGNPVYVERCMESVKGIRDLWTGINSKGHRHFKSSWYSSTKIDTTAPKDCDLEMNTRTVKAALWLAWYNRHPFVMQFLKEWGDSWLEDCLRTEKGKPKGIVPAAVRYSNDEIGGHSDNWHHPNMFWDYFNYRGGARILNLLLLNSIFFDDDKYLEPIYLSMELIKKYNGIDLEDSDEGTEEWTVNILRNSDNFWEVIELWRLYKNDTKYDDLIMHVGSPYIKYYLSKKEQDLIDPLKEIINDLLNNYKLNTTEGYFTDRVELRDMREGDSRASGLMEAMYTGSSLVDAAYPFNRISWKGFSKNLSALVTESTSSNINIKTYIHSSIEETGEILFLDFIPGVYSIKIGSDSEGDLKVDSQISESSFTIEGRNSQNPITLLPGVEQIIEIKLVKKSSKEALYMLPDLAITKEELVISKLAGHEVDITIPIHNIGIKNAGNIEVILFGITESGIEEEIASYIIKDIEAPLDLEAKTNRMSLRLANLKSGKYKIIVDPSNKTEELNEGNNTIYFNL